MADETTAKPWYLSKSVIAGVAGILMAVAPKLALLVGITLPLTQDQANAVAVFLIPQAVALYGRLTATKVITATAAKASLINEQVK